MLNSFKLRNSLVIFSVLFFLLGCATTSSEKVDFHKGGKITFIVADRRPGSILLTRAFIEKYREKKKYSVTSEERIGEVFPNYPENIFTNNIAGSIELTDFDRTIMAKIGKKFEGDFLCFVSLSLQTGNGGVILYDENNNSVISGYNFVYGFSPPTTFFSLIYHAIFERDEEKYLKKKLRECADFIEKKGFSSL